MLLEKLNELTHFASIRGIVIILYGSNYIIIRQNIALGIATHVETVALQEWKAQEVKGIRKFGQVM